MINRSVFPIFQVRSEAVTVRIISHDGMSGKHLSSRASQARRRLNT